MFRNAERAEKITTREGLRPLPRRIGKKIKLIEK